MRLPLSRKDFRKICVFPAREEHVRATNPAMKNFKFKK